MAYESKADASPAQPSAGAESAAPESPEYEHLDLEESSDPSPEPPPPLQHYDIEPKFRGWIAIFLLGILAIIVMASFFLFWDIPDRFDKDLKDLIALLLSPIVALVGSATGYYFGTQSRASNKQ